MSKAVNTQKFLFEHDKSNLVSATFAAPKVVTAFNLTGMQTTKVDGVLQIEYCGDEIYFEQLVYDADYGLNCDGISEKGILGSELLRDKCGEVVKLSKCRNSVTLTRPGIYRAVFKGDSRKGKVVIAHEIPESYQFSQGI